MKNQEVARPASQSHPRQSTLESQERVLSPSNPIWYQLATRASFLSTLGSSTTHLPLQAKLAVSSPDDPYEREADRVADQVMRMPAGASGAPALSFISAAASTAQRQC